MKFVLLVFFVIIAADVARSQGVRRERPPDLPKTSTKKGKRPSGRPIRVRNFGPPPPPRPPGRRDIYDFNFYHRRKDPIIPVELHPPILQRPKPKDSFRERPRSRSADGPKRRRTTTTESTPPTTYYDLTTFPTTSTTPSTAPPTQPPVKTTTKPTTASPAVPKVKPQTTTKVSVQKSNVGVQGSADKTVTSPNDEPTKFVPKQSYKIADTPPLNSRSIDYLEQTPNAMSNDRMYAQTFFGANKIPRPPPPPSQSFGPVRGIKRKFKFVPQSNPIFETQRGSNSKFRRPSDIPAELKPNIISSLTTEKMAKPPPSNPEKYASGQKTQVKNNIETQQSTKRVLHMPQGIQNKQSEVMYERVSPSQVLNTNRDTNMKQNAGPMDTQTGQSVLTSKYFPQPALSNVASSLTSSSGSDSGSLGSVSKPKAQPRNISPEVASAFIENRMPQLPQRSPSGDKGYRTGEWQNQRMQTKPFRTDSVKVIQNNNAAVTDGLSVDQTNLSVKSQSFGSRNNVDRLKAPHTNNYAAASPTKTKYLSENKPFGNNVKVTQSSTQTSGIDNQFQRKDINRPMSGMSQNTVPYEESIRPTASKFNTMNMKSGVISSVRQNFNGNAGTSRSQKTPSEQASKIPGGQQISQRIASPIFPLASVRRGIKRQNKPLKPFQNVGMLGPKLVLDRPEFVKNSQIIGEPAITPKDIADKRQSNLPVQRPTTSRRAKENRFRTVGSSGPSIGTLFDHSAESASYSLGLDQTSNKDINSGRISSQSKQISGRNPSRPLSKTSENSQRGDTPMNKEPYVSKAEQRSIEKPTLPNYQNQLPGLKQLPDYTSSRHTESLADLNTRLVKENPTIQRRQQSLVKPTLLPDRRSLSRPNEQFHRESAFNQQGPKPFINMPAEEVGPSPNKNISPKMTNTGSSMSGGSDFQQNKRSNVFSKSEPSRKAGQIKKSRIENNNANDLYLDSQVNGQKTMSITNSPGEQSRDPSQRSQKTVLKSSAFNSGSDQTKNERTAQSQIGQSVNEQLYSSKNANIAKQKKPGQSSELSSRGDETVSSNNGHSDRIQNNAQGNEKKQRVESKPGYEPLQKAKIRAKSTKAPTTLKSTPMKMSKSASERVRKVGSLMLEAFKNFMSKINGGKTPPLPNHHGKTSHKQGTGQSADKRGQNKPTDLLKKKSESKKLAGNKRNSSVQNSKDSISNSKLSKSKSTKYSSQNVVDALDRNSPSQEVTVKKANIKRQSPRQSKTPLNQGSNSNVVSQTTTKNTQPSKSAFNHGSNSNSVSQTTTKNKFKSNNNEKIPNSSNEKPSGKIYRDSTTMNGKQVHDKTVSQQHTSKGNKSQQLNRGNNNELVTSSDNSSMDSSQTKTTKPIARAGSNKGYRFESEVISGPPPPSFRKNKNKSPRPRKHNQRNSSNGKRIRSGKKEGRSGSKEIGSRNIAEKDPPGYNVPAGAHPPVLTRPVSKTSSHGGSSAPQTSAEKTSTAKTQKRGGKPGQGPCSLSPVCGSDGFTYMSSCFLWEGLTVECDGYCPCANEPGQPVPKQTSQTGVIREPVPSPMCNCPAKYSPVCSTTGTTFENDCARACNGEEIACDGECPCPTSQRNNRKPCESYCSATIRPVCSVWGYSYENDCLRHCSGEAKACDGECPCPYSQNVAMDQAGGSYDPQNVNNEPSNQPLSTCECGPGDIDPVCTTSGETLWYGCKAICLGYTIACSSECPC